MVIVFILGVAHSSVYADTHYVNADSSGAATNPNRAFNEPGYAANDSYQTLTAAYTAATAGDTIEFSGGTTGKSYAGRAAGIAKQLTFQGSQISGHNGTVTIIYDATTGYAFGANADGIILQNLTFSGSNTGKALVILKNNITGTNIILKDAGGDLYHLTIAAAAGNSSTFTNLIIYGNTVGRGITLASNTGTANFNNCIVNAVSNVGVYMNSGATANFTNCTFTSNGTITSNMFYYNGGGTINTTNCFVQGSYQYPLVPTAGTGAKTWNSTNDIIDGFPYLTRTKANMGYIAFSTDDTIDLDYCIANANYAMNTYSIPITCYISPTDSLTEGDKTKLQTLYKAGHEVGVHTRHHNDFSKLNGITVTYSGANADMAFVVSGSGTSLSVTGTSDTHGPINLTNSSYDTLGELCTAIGGWSSFACSVVTNISTSTLSTSLKDASTALPKTVATGIPFDDSALAANRYFTEEITNAISDLETAIHLDPSCSGYTVKTIAFPYNTSSAALLTWLQAHTNLLGARANSSVGINTEKVWLGAVNVFNAYNRPDYPDFLGDGLQASVEKSARVLATYASNGFFTGMLIHSATEMTNQQWAWMLDELVKYRTQYNITISSFANLISAIRTSNDWTDGGGGTWTRTFTGSDDLRSTYNSPMINAGTAVAGRTTDILGNPIVGTPDIGPYEFQSPIAPTSLAQYKSDGTTAISAGGWTKETSAVLKFFLSSINSSDSLTPHVEIQPNATAFTNTETNPGTAVAYSGTPVTGTVTVTSLSDGTIYHWQARGSNAASTGAWTALGGNPDFGVDTSAPTIPGTPSTTTPTATTKPVWTWTASTDGSSGLPTTPYTIQWCGNSGFTGCGANVSTSNTNTFTHGDALSDGTWYIRVRAADAVGNVSDYSSNGTVVIDTTGPTITVGTPTTTTSGGTINWSTNEAASSKVEYGLTDSYGSTTGETDISPRVLDHAVLLAGLLSCTEYHYRVLSKDALLNEQTGSDQVFTTTGCTGSAQATATASAQLLTSAGGSLTLKDSQMKGLLLTVPSGFAASDATFQAHHLDKTAVLGITGKPSGYAAAGDYLYELKALSDTTTTISSFSTSLSLAISYAASDTTGLNESSLRIWRWDGTSWNMLSGCTVDTSAKTVTCETASFSVFGLFGQSPASDSSAASTGASSVESGTGATGKSCPDAPPGAKAPWLYSAVSLDDTHVQLYFTDADDPVDGYILIFGTASGEYQYGSLYIGNKGMRTYTVGYLSPVTTYYFRVQGKHGCQPGPRSNEISATTDSTTRWDKLGISSSVVLGTTAPQTPNDVLAEEHKAEPTVFTGYEMRVKVLDRNNTPVVGATVTIHSTPRRGITDSNGIAQFQNVEPGQHQISIDYDGFKGEQSMTLEGNTKRFDVEIKVQKEHVLFSFQVLAIIIVLIIVIFVLSILLIKSKNRQRRR